MAYTYYKHVPEAMGKILQAGQILTERRAWYAQK